MRPPRTTEFTVYGSLIATLRGLLSTPTKKIAVLIIEFLGKYTTLRVQVPNNHILTQNLYYNCYYPNPKHLIIWYMDPLG